MLFRSLLPSLNSAELCPVCRTPVVFHGGYSSSGSSYESTLEVLLHILDIPLYTASMSMVDRVVQVLPDVPRLSIIKDISVTGSVDATIDRLRKPSTPTSPANPSRHIRPLQQQQQQQQQHPQHQHFLWERDPYQRNIHIESALRVIDEEQSSSRGEPLTPTLTQRPVNAFVQRRLERFLQESQDSSHQSLRGRAITTGGDTQS